MNTAVIALGSNIDAATNMDRAVERLKILFKVEKVSHWMKTTPIGITDQAEFLNGAILLNTSLDINTLKTTLKNLEDQMGRDRTRPKFGPREIDLDVIIWNNQVVDEDYHTRDFLQLLSKEVMQ